MIAWLLTLTGSYFAGKLIQSIWFAGLAGIVIGLASGTVGGVLVGVFGGDLFTPGEVILHVIGSAFLQMIVGLIATLAFRAFLSRAQDDDRERPTEPLRGCPHCGAYVPDDSFLCSSCNRPVGTEAE